LYVSLESLTYSYRDSLNKIAKSIDANASVQISGEFRRKCEIIDKLDFLIASHKSTEIKAAIINQLNQEIVENNKVLHLKDENGIHIYFHFCIPEDYVYELFVTTGNEDHVNAIKDLIKDKQFDSEEALYA